MKTARLKLSLKLLTLVAVVVMLATMVKLDWRHKQLQILSPNSSQPRPKPPPPPAVVSLHLRQFRQLHWPAPACGNQSLLVIGIISRPPEFRARSVRRRLFCSVAEHEGYRIRCIFVLGQSTNASLQRSVDAEAAEFGDILQLSFSDTYGNLTYKTLSLLDWTVSGCPSAQFVLKTDSDCLVNPYKLAEKVRSQRPEVAKKLYGGRLLFGGAPRRGGQDKWQLSHAEFPGNSLPPYVQGFGYIISRQAATEILRGCDKAPVIRIEDVYVGICARNAGLRPVSLHPAMKYYYWNKNDYCTYRDGVVMHDVTGAKLTEMWRLLTLSPDRKPKCLH